MTEPEIRAHALNMWANWLETGDVILSREDCILQKTPEKIRPLIDEQLRMVDKLRRMAAQEINGTT